MAMNLTASLPTMKPPLLEGSICFAAKESKILPNGPAYTSAPSLRRLRRQSSSSARPTSNVGAAPRPQHHLDAQLRLHNVSSVSRAYVVRASSESGATDNRPSIGFLGLGNMGFAMARNLVKAGAGDIMGGSTPGYNVSVWNRTGSKCDPLVQEGAKYIPTPEGITAACDITFAMLANPDTAISVTTGENGALKGLGPNKGYVDVSTVGGDTAKFISEKVKATGALYLEAPVSGTKQPAEQGQLIFLTAGDKELYDWASPMLDVMGKSKYFLGDVGNGAAMKLIVNMIMGSMMASFSEGLQLGDKAGLDLETIVKVIGEGTVSAPMFAVKGPAMVKGNYPTAFALKHQQKDLRLVLAMAENLSQPLPVTASVNKLYEQAQTEGLGEEDFSAVMEALKA